VDYSLEWDEDARTVVISSILEPQTGGLYGITEPLLIWLDFNELYEPLNITLPEDFYEVRRSPTWEGSCIFILRYQDQYIRLIRSDTEMANGWFRGDMVGSLEINGYTIYYRNEPEFTVVTFEKDRFFYHISGDRALDVKIEILLLIVEAAIEAIESTG